jgi:hypothetical protein
MLRNIADQIDSGDYGAVTTIVVAFQSDEGVETFGGGRDADYRFCSWLFSVGATRASDLAE